MTAFTITLPLPPRELSPNHRAHRMVKWRKGKVYKERARLFALEALGRHRPRWTAATMQLEWFTKSVTRPDADNALSQMKQAIDGLTVAGVLADDRGLTHQPIRFAKDAQNPRVVIHVTPTAEI